MDGCRKAAAAIGLAGALIGLGGCMSEVLERQAEQIRQQNEEIARQRKEIEALAGGRKIQEQKQRDCNRAFREFFDKAQASSRPEESIALYRKGLDLCPDDDVAHYELGKTLAADGQRAEAEKEFAAALAINPDFAEARRQLDALRDRR